MCAYSRSCVLLIPAVLLSFSPHPTTIHHSPTLFCLPVCSFVLANARIVDYPIVYCNEGFSRLTGYSRVDIMQKSGNCAYFYGEQTSTEMRERLLKALDSQTPDQIEMLLYKKNRTSCNSPIWVLVCVAPVRNEQEEVVLFLLAFRDITPLKTPFEDEETTKGE
ncbi:unnamed protein product [Echinostoma caproni]|uniref:PAS domain-containing protein n=1 Tax=Echinostoma caproni TaxID=27848 RepID=A0A183ACM6_9TREM|nr:unnamed protein product [Echinostoma caproni]